MMNRTKRVAVGLLAAGGLSLGVGMGVSIADAQPPASGPGGAGGRGSAGTAPGVAAGQPTQPQGQPGMFGRGGGSGSGATTALFPREWEYKFETAPASSDEMRKLVTKLGDDGWEFAGPVSFGRSTDLVFKRPKAGGFGMSSGGGFNPVGGEIGGFGAVGAANVDELAESAFKRRDRNGDGKLSKEEAVSVARLADEFSQYDKNKDGSISLDEYKAFAQPRMVGGPGAPGAVGSGRLPGGLGVPGDAARPAMELKLYQLKNADAQSMVRILTDVFGKPNLRVIADVRTNTVIVHGPSADLDIIAALISRLDGSEGAIGRKDPVRR